MMNAKDKQKDGSDSGFRDLFARIMEATPISAQGRHKILKAAWLDLPVAPMIAIADEIELYLLEFMDRGRLEREMERLRHQLKAAIIPGETLPIVSIRKELDQYFTGQLKEFKTPLGLLGSTFQQSVWAELKKIPIGTTCSYAELACRVGNPKAYRAVANANGANQLAIIIPCHRVIKRNGELGGYGGGIRRKQWLIDHEEKINVTS